MTSHQAYNPGLVPRDYFLLSALKQRLRRTRFKDDIELQSTIEAYNRKNAHTVEPLQGFS